MKPKADVVVAIDHFLADEGFTPASALIARSVLEEAGLTRPGKQGMNSQKLDRARAILATELLRVCNRPDCQAAIEGSPVGQRVAEVHRSGCDICGGSNNQGAVRAMARSCASAGVGRVLIVGGTPRLQQVLSRLVGTEPEVQFVSGIEKEPNQRDALMDCAWADLVVIWAPTPLPHKVSTLYGPDVCDADRVTVHRRGIEALAQAVSSHLGGAPGRVRPS